MREWAAELVARARAEGVELTGDDGLLTALVRARRRRLDRPGRCRPHAPETISTRAESRADANRESSVRRGQVENGPGDATVDVGVRSPSRRAGTPPSPRPCSATAAAPFMLTPL